MELAAGTWAALLGRRTATTQRAGARRTAALPSTPVDGGQPERLGLHLDVDGAELRERLRLGVRDPDDAESDDARRDHHDEQPECEAPLHDPTQHRRRPSAWEIRRRSVRALVAVVPRLSRRPEGVQLRFRLVAWT
jgi:hypothetical protein